MFPFHHLKQEQRSCYACNLGGLDPLGHGKGMEPYLSVLTAVLSAGSNGSSIAAGTESTAMLSCMRKLLCHTRLVVVVCAGLSSLATMSVFAWLAICKDSGICHYWNFHPKGPTAFLCP